MKLSKILGYFGEVVSVHHWIHQRAEFSGEKVPRASTKLSRLRAT
jgi:hypothetical protein